MNNISINRLSVYIICLLTIIAAKGMGSGLCRDCNADGRNNVGTESDATQIELPESIFSGYHGKHHVQGIVVDVDKECVYFSFTTKLVKTDLSGNLIGSVEGLTGHLGCLTLNPADGRIYGSIEYKNDEIGVGIVGERARNRRSAFYIAVFDGDKITRPNMTPSDNDVMSTVYLKDVVKDYYAQGTNNGKSVEHRYGCSGIDGVAFAPQPCASDSTLWVLYVAYGIYGDIGRSDNDYQVLLTYDTSDWEKYERVPNQDNPHKSGPAKPLGRYFVYTGNSEWGIQNLNYNPEINTLVAAVYKGKKKEYPNYSLFAIDLSATPNKERLKGHDKKEHGYTLPLKKMGLYDESTGIYGWRFPYGSTGICYVGNSLYYISHNSSKPEQSSTLTLYRWTGNQDCPFEKINSDIIQTFGK